MTEASRIATRVEHPESDITGAVGRPIPNVDMKLVDDNGKDLGEVYGTRGEICLWGPTIVPGYHNNPKANAESFDADGFYHTGDIGYCDAKTKLWYIVDRKKELIKVRAFQHCRLRSHWHSVEAARGRAHRVAEGIRGSEAGTREQDLTEDMVKDYVKPKLARYKWLEGGVRFVEVIPQSANGKTLKRVLREEAKKEAASAGKSKL
jgi:acyl-CoA synthetase (AMP-forming)/AMP-acid ligase II